MSVADTDRAAGTGRAELLDRLAQGGTFDLAVVGGGATVNNLLMQIQADLLGIPVLRPAVTETTALGAAYLAGLATGVWKNTGELAALWAIERRFEPQMAPALAKERMAHWEHAVKQATA